MNLKCLRSFVAALLLPLGIVENVKYKRYQLVCFLVYHSLIIYLIFGTVVGLINTTDVGGIWLQMGPLTTILNSLMMTWYFKFSAELVLRLISKLRENGYKWPKAGEKMEQFIGSTVLKVFCWYYGMFFFIVLPIFVGIPATSTKGIDEKNSFLIPFWYYCGDASTTTSWTNLMCWKVDDAFELLISNVMQTVLCLLIFHALITYLLFYTILITNVKVHVELLNENLRQMVKQWDEDKFQARRSQQRAEDGSLFGEEFCSGFEDILKHQRFIREFTKEVTKLVQWLVMINVMGIFISLTFTLYFTIVEKTNDTMLSSKLANMSLMMIVSFFIYCYNSQTISDLNQRIFESMLQIPWYRQNISFRKKYAIALCLNQKPISVKACKMYEVNLSLFLSFMKTIYTVTNIMLLKY